MKMILKRGLVVVLSVCLIVPLVGVSEVKAEDTKNVKEETAEKANQKKYEDKQVQEDIKAANQMSIQADPKSNSVQSKAAYGTFPTRKVLF